MRNTLLYRLTCWLVGWLVVTLGSLLVSLDSNFAAAATMSLRQSLFITGSNYFAATNAGSNFAAVAKMSLRQSLSITGSMVARRRGSGVRLPLGLVVARQSQALCRTYN